MRRWLLAALFALVPMMAQATTVEIYFICNTQSGATEVAHQQDVAVGITPLPNGCQWVMDHQHRQAQILEVLNEVHLSTGDIVHVARVQTHNRIGYSAGYLFVLQMM